MKITLSCCLCSETVEIKATTPEGWSIRYEDIDEEHSFCPKHKPVEEFARFQCPGCVGGWQDCTMWKSFAYSHQRNLSPADFQKIESGICPKRTNGTMSFSRSMGIENIDLSDRAPVESGMAFAQAIRDYWTAYPETSK